MPCLPIEPELFQGNIFCSQWLSVGSEFDLGMPPATVDLLSDEERGSSKQPPGTVPEKGADSRKPASTTATSLAATTVEAVPEVPVEKNAAKKKTKKTADEEAGHVTEAEVPVPTAKKGPKKKKEKATDEVADHEVAEDETEVPIPAAKNKPKGPSQSVGGKAKAKPKSKPKAAVKTAAKSKAKGKAKAKAKSKAVPDDGNGTDDEKPLVDTASGAAVKDGDREEVKKRPAANPKRSAAAKKVKTGVAEKYKYHKLGKWGIRMNGTEYCTVRVQVELASIWVSVFFQTQFPN